MRKTYKPLAKQSKLANTYRKKTLDHRIDLDIKKDKDDLENVEEFWCAAGSVLDDTTIIEVPKDDSANENANTTVNSVQADKKNTAPKVTKNIPKDLETYLKKKEVVSFKKDLNNDFVVENIDSSTIESSRDLDSASSQSDVDLHITSDNKILDNKSSMSIIENIENKQNTPVNGTRRNDKNNESSNDTLFDIKNIRESLSHKASSTSKNSNTSGFETSSTKNKESFDVSIGPISNNDISKDSYGTNPPIPMKMKNFKVKNKKVEDKTKLEISEPEKQDSCLYNYNGESLFSKNGAEVGMSKISSMSGGKSRLEPLVSNQSLETGLLFLTPGSHIVEDKAEVSFSLYIIKGSLRISLNGDFLDIKRDSCFVFKKGDIYSLANAGRNESVVFVTYITKKLNS